VHLNQSVFGLVSPASNKPAMLLNYAVKAALCRLTIFTYAITHPDMYS
jgi:hypothetical protein